MIQFCWYQLCVNCDLCCTNMRYKDLLCVGMVVVNNKMLDQPTRVDVITPRNAQKDDIVMFHVSKVSQNGLRISFYAPYCSDGQSYCFRATPRKSDRIQDDIFPIQMYTIKQAVFIINNYYSTIMVYLQKCNTTLKVSFGW